MNRSKSRWDYVDRGYNREWLVKSDLTPGNLKSFGIKASVKDIKQKSEKAKDGWITTGGQGHWKHVKTYSISKLRDLFK